MKNFNLTNTLIASLSIAASFIFALFNLLEFYSVRIQNNIENYPFGGEGPVPYYYKSVELYSTVCLLSGLLFLASGFFAIWTLKKSHAKWGLMAFGITLLLFIAQILNGEIGVSLI